MMTSMVCYSSGGGFASAGGGICHVSAKSSNVSEVKRDPSGRMTTVSPARRNLPVACGGRCLSREAFNVSGYLPTFPRIFDHRAAIAIGCLGRCIERHSACFESALVCRIDIIDIQIEKCRHRLAWSDAADHHIRVADSDHRRPVRFDDILSRRKLALENRSVMFG